MTDLRAAAAEYLAIRRSLGFKLRDYDRLLEDFIGSLEASGTETVTVQSALTWATSVTGTSPKRCGDRLGAVRGFARHLHGFDHTVEVPPPDLLVYRQLRPRPTCTRQRTSPAWCGLLRPCGRPFRGLTYEAVFGLLATTGMRVGEVLRLDDGDVDLQTGVIEITDTKFNSTGSSRCMRRSCRPSPLRRGAGRAAFWRAKDPSLFVSTRGTRLLYASVHEAFHVLLGELHLDASTVLASPDPRIAPQLRGRDGARLVSLRTSAEGKLPILSAYLVTPVPRRDRRPSLVDTCSWCVRCRAEWTLA